MNTLKKRKPRCSIAWWTMHDGRAVWRMNRRGLSLIIAMVLCVMASACAQRDGDGTEVDSSSVSSRAQTHSAVLMLEGQAEAVLYTTIQSAAFPYYIDVDEQRFSFHHDDGEGMDVISYRSNDSQGAERISIFFQEPLETSGEDDFIRLAAKTLESIGYTVEDAQQVTVGRGHYFGKRIVGTDGKHSQEFYSFHHEEHNVIVNMTYSAGEMEDVAARMRHMLSTFEITS